MWRPCRKNSLEITIRRYLPDQGLKDDFGHSIRSSEDEKIIAEVYPYTDPAKRQAIGITTEKAYTVIFTGSSIEEDNEIIIGGEVYQMASRADYTIAMDNPLQLVVKDTGRRTNG